jgi:hypothetical protein
LKRGRPLYTDENAILTFSDGTRSEECQRDPSSI